MCLESLGGAGAGIIDMSEPGCRRRLRGEESWRRSEAHLRDGLQRRRLDGGLHGHQALELRRGSDPAASGDAIAEYEQFFGLGVDGLRLDAVHALVDESGKVLGVVPYIALQLKAISGSFSMSIWETAASLYSDQALAFSFMPFCAASLTIFSLWPLATMRMATTTGPISRATNHASARALTISTRSRIAKNDPAAMNSAFVNSNGAATNSSMLNMSANTIEPAAAAVVPVFNSSFGFRSVGTGHSPEELAGVLITEALATDEPRARDRDRVARAGGPGRGGPGRPRAAGGR